ncbi:MAG: tetratricopeptide repeat protein, partial [Longimicrobiales bacterium]
MNPETLTSRRLLALFSAVVAAVVYLNSLANGFALDDVSIVQLNKRVHDALDLREIWLTPYWPLDGRELGLYRPATIFLFAVQWAAGDGQAWLFHAVNIGLHAAVTALVFLLLDRLTGRAAALAGALVFAVHPVHTEAVANIVGQAEIVGAFLVLAACVLHVERPAGVVVSWPRRVLLVLLFAWALCTKESTVVLPALLIIVDLAHGRVSRRGVAEYADAMLMPLLLLAATLAAWLILRFDVMGGSVIGVDAAPAMPYLRGEHRVLNALRAFPELIRLLFFPWDLAADYLPGILLPVESVRPMVLLGAALLAALSLLALVTPWRPQAGFPAAWFLISIATVSNLFFPVGVLVAERTLYLPSLAISAAAAYGWRAASRRGAPWVRRALPVGLVALLLVLGGRTWIRNPDWKDTLAVMNAFVRDHPHSYRAQWALASSHRIQGDVAAADARYRLATTIYDRDARLLTEYAELLLSMARFDEAIALLER